MSVFQEEAPVERTFRTRLILANAGVILVLTLMALAALFALRTTGQRVAEARQIDHRIALLDDIRGDAREIAVSARRYILSGELEEQQRVVAIVHEMRAERRRLAARTTLAKGAELEADLEEYIASLTNAMYLEDADPIVRLSRFEDELARVRPSLTSTFNEVIARERARREALRSGHALARIAQWAVGIACALGIVLVIASLRAMMRKLAPSARTETITRSRNELVAAASELRAPLENIIADSSHLRLRRRDSSEARVLDNIAKHASRVNAMLAELLDVSAIQTGATSLRREAVDAPALVDRAVRDHREDAQRRTIRLRYEAQLAVTVFADRERIKHVLDSMLQIAISAARPGAELVVHVAAAEAGIRFAIIEPGPSTDWVVDHDLALHLCSRVVEAHGGRLGIQASSISRTYWFTLPTEPSLLR